VAYIVSVGRYVTINLGEIIMKKMLLATTLLVVISLTSCAPSSLEQTGNKNLNFIGGLPMRMSVGEQRLLDLVVIHSTTKRIIALDALPPGWAVTVNSNNSHVATNKVQVEISPLIPADPDTDPATPEIPAVYGSLFFATGVSEGKGAFTFTLTNPDGAVDSTLVIPFVIR
jgi:hypothetical protein